MFNSDSKLHWIKNLYLRLRYGAGCCDVFNLDYYLAKKILGPLKVFRKELVSYPSGLSSSEEWEEILDKMIYSFEYIIKKDDLYLSVKEERIEMKKADEGLKLFAKYYQDLWK